ERILQLLPDPAGHLSGSVDQVMTPAPLAYPRAERFRPAMGREIGRMPEPIVGEQCEIRRRPAVRRPDLVLEINQDLRRLLGNGLQETGALIVENFIPTI